MVREMAEQGGTIDAEHRYCCHDVMERTTISISDELLQRLRVVAAERRTSIAALIREAVEEKVNVYRPKPKSIGMGDSGRTDISERSATERPIPRSWR